MKAYPEIRTADYPALTRYGPLLLILLYSLVITAPIFYYGHPQFFNSPDLLYVQAKTLRVAQGDIFQDPVTGFPTFHPPFYHLFLAGPYLLGFGIEKILMVVTWFNIFATAFFTYLVLRRKFSQPVALAVPLFMPFVHDYLGPGLLLLASSYYFAVPFYLAGLWLYLKDERPLSYNLLIAVLWGLAFLISPVFIFLIGFTFIYELLFKAHRYHTLAMIVLFGIILIPFYIQAWYIYGTALGGTGAFSFWRGFPNWLWIRNNAVLSIFPVTIKMHWWHFIIGTAVWLWGLYALWKNRPIVRYFFICLLAYILTSYHFNFQYATRIKSFLLIFILAYGFKTFFDLKISARLKIIVTAVLILIAWGDHMYFNVSLNEEARDVRSDMIKRRSDAINNLGPYLDRDRYVIATEKTYRFYLMPYYPVYGLMAYTSGEYYQLKKELSDEMKNDYSLLISTDDDRIIDEICRKYRMDTAVLCRYEPPTLFTLTVAEKWDNVYSGPSFMVYKKPETKKITP